MRVLIIFWRVVWGLVKLVILYPLNSHLSEKFCNAGSLFIPYCSVSMTIHYAYHTDLKLLTRFKSTAATRRAKMICNFNFCILKHLLSFKNYALLCMKKGQGMHQITKLFIGSHFTPASQQSSFVTHSTKRTAFGSL